MERKVDARALLEELRAKYPQKDFQIDAVTGKIGFVHKGMFITDPWLSDCGRFDVSPRSEYGIKILEAVKIKALNLPVEIAEEIEEQRFFESGEYDEWVESLRA